MKLKVLSFLLPFVLIVPFILYSRAASYKMTGIRQFSFFTGWQLANNAMYIYDQINVDSNSLPTAEARHLNRYMIRFLKRFNQDGYRDYLEAFQGKLLYQICRITVKGVLFNKLSFNGEINTVKNWGRASADFEPFGKYLIVHHPVAYARYFMLPNTRHYFVPPLLHLEQYNYYGVDSIEPIAKDWFHYPSLKVHCVSRGLQGFLIAYVAFFLLFNVYIVWQLIRHLARAGFRSFLHHLPKSISGSAIISFMQFYL
ncbi:hypothetical protein ACQ86N_39025 [Puia sp. P3]|uniref:hypothetical protein n=1 Tax=Puia sp. P3 TaxID=3423952 RepID=UPI003D66DDFD